MARHKNHDAADLEDALEHIVYEIWKHKQSVALYGAIQCAGGDAALEFRVLHHRVLLEFFYGPAKHEDNIVAWEYIDDWRQSHDRSALAWIDGYVNRCHTMLAHISTSRSRMAKQGLKSWTREFQLVEPHLNQLILEFLQGLSKTHKDICARWMGKWRNYQPPGTSLLDGLITSLKEMGN